MASGMAELCRAQLVKLSNNTTEIRNQNASDGSKVSVTVKVPA